MKKKEEIHIFATDNEDGQKWNHRGWFFSLKRVVDGRFVRFGKLYRSRSAAAREANKHGKTIHWYPI